uniref:hypothetical protein n=1 Tax=Cephaleuros parasiticus TaxID=173370 RepID=UPI001EDCAC0D|nr:hypothetical protein MFQ79_pgp053 [Cephaleuros parasiticus]UIB39009.1 hypothetical protein [Cephaleuros parasiticus]
MPNSIFSVFQHDFLQPLEKEKDEVLFDSVCSKISPSSPPPVFPSISMGVDRRIDKQFFDRRPLKLREKPEGGEKGEEEKNSPLTLLALENLLSDAEFFNKISTQQKKFPFPFDTLSFLNSSQRATLMKTKKVQSLVFNPPSSIFQSFYNLEKVNVPYSCGQVKSSRPRTYFS